MKFTDALTRKALSGRLFVNLVNGQPWATNSYWLVRYELEGPLKHLSDKYNLDLTKPACYDVDPTPKISGSTAPNIENLLNITDKLVEVTPRIFNSAQVLIRLPKDDKEPLCRVYDRPNGTVLLNDLFMSFIEAHWPEEVKLFQSEAVPALRPVIVEARDKQVGLIMPIRHEA